MRGIRACVFDAYGTLFDVASGVQRCADELRGSASQLAALWRDKQLQYTWLRTVQDRHADFWQITGDALDFALEALQLTDAGLRARLMQHYLRIDAYPDALPALRQLRDSGSMTAILSNGSPEMLAAAVTGSGLGNTLGQVLSVEEVGVYKPHRRVYQLAVDRLHIPAGQIAFVSSNGWDAWAASAFGMKVVWCNRSGQHRERLPGAPDHEIRSLAELPPLLES